MGNAGLAVVDCERSRLMSGFWKGVSGIASVFTELTAGDHYRKGFEDARSGVGKDPDHVSRSSRRRRKPDVEMGKALDPWIEAYEQGYSDGLEREEMEIRRDRARRPTYGRWEY